MRSAVHRFVTVGLLLPALAAPVAAAPTFSSQADQYLFVGEGPRSMSAVTITDDPTTAEITAANDIRIRIPAGFNMTWDTSDNTAMILGGAAAKVSATVTFEDADQTVVLDVTADFAPSDQFIMSGLLFANFTAVSPFDSLELEVANDGAVAALDDKTIKIINKNATRSGSITVTPDGSEVWVVNPDHGSVSVIDAVTNTLVAEISVAPEPWSVAIHPLFPEAWVTSMGNHHVYIVDTGTRAVIDSIAAGFETFGVAINPQGTKALVTASGSDELLVIDVETRTVTHTLPVHRRPRGIAFRGEGGRAWITHLMMPEFTGVVTTYFASTNTTSQIGIGQVFSQNLGGYPSVSQNIAVAPAPGDSVLWIPNSMLHTSNGQLFGNPLSATNMFHACIRPVNHITSTDMTSDTYYLSESGTDVGGPIDVAFNSNRAYVANLHSDNVTVLTQNILSTTEVTVLPVGKAPIGVAASPTMTRVYVANWLSRDVTVIGTGLNVIITTVPATSSEVLLPRILNGKQHFFTSTGNMSINNRTSCASCHIWGTHDSRPWDLSQFGKHIRATPDVRGIGWTGAHDWTSDKDEMADHDFGIHEFAGGPGLIPGGGNPPLGAPNTGLSPDMDDIGFWMSTLTHRKETPFLVAGAQTANADSGEVLFNDPTVGCATCHVPPLYTDSRLQLPFIKHDVGTADPGDADGAAGFDTPSLVGAWDMGPYLHTALATTLQSVMTTWNPSDLHGTTSQLSTMQIDFIAEFIQSIGWPDSTGTPVDAPVVTPAGSAGGLEDVFPNPFDEGTSLRFALEANAARVVIDVFDVQGRHVATLLDRAMTRGTHVVGWDSRDESGRRVGAGIYFARYSVDGEERGGKKMVVLH